jgi:hypothetical protein
LVAANVNHLLISILSPLCSKGIAGSPPKVLLWAQKTATTSNILPSSSITAVVSSRKVGCTLLAHSKVMGNSNTPHHRTMRSTQQHRTVGSDGGTNWLQCCGDMQS